MTRKVGGRAKVSSKEPDFSKQFSMEFCLDNLPGKIHERLQIIWGLRVKNPSNVKYMGKCESKVESSN